MALVPMKPVFCILTSFSPLRFPVPSLSNVSMSADASPQHSPLSLNSYSARIWVREQETYSDLCHSDLVPCLVCSRCLVFKSFKGSTWTLNLAFHNVELSNHPKLRFSYIRENINYLYQRMDEGIWDRSWKYYPVSPHSIPPDLSAILWPSVNALLGLKVTLGPRRNFNVYLEELRTWRIIEVWGCSVGLQNTHTAGPGIQNLL